MAATCRCGGSLSSTCTTDSSTSFSVDDASPCRPVSIPPVKTKFSSKDSFCWDSVSRSPTFHFPSASSPSPKTSIELRKEIAILEADILHLERYLLLLYRTAFKERGSSLSNVHTSCMLDKFGHDQASPDSTTPSLHAHRERLVQRAVILRKFGEKFPFRGSSASHDLDHRATLQSTSSKEESDFVSGRRSLADYFEFSSVLEHAKTPVKLSEDMIKCISSIYSRVATSIPCSTPTPTSSTLCGSSASRCSGDTDLQNWLRSAKAGNAPSSELIEVLSIRFDNDSFKDVASVFKCYRSLVRKLEKVDPQKMKREEKLAFWINIHNALIMHAYLVFGTENRARDTSCAKAVYNIGGHPVNAHIIQQSILGIRSHFSERWLQALFSPARKPRKGYGAHVYALDYPEPQVHFALCSGALTDPMVRVYSAKGIFQELKLAREEFIQSSISVHNGSKIFLPKLLSFFAKDMALDITRLLEMVKDSVPDVERDSHALRKCRRGKPGKICWSEQVTSFRYVIHGDLAKDRYM